MNKTIEIFLIGTPHSPNSQLGRLLTNQPCYEVTHLHPPVNDELFISRAPLLVVLDLLQSQLLEDEIQQLCGQCEMTATPILFCGDEEQILPIFSIPKPGTSDFIIPPFSEFVLSQRIERLLLASKLLSDRRIVEAYLSTLINNLTFDFWVMDEEQRYTLQNNHSLEQWGDCRGKTIDDLNLPEELKTTWKKQARKSYAGEIIRCEYTSTLNDQEVFLESTISPIVVGQKTIGIIGITVDISKFKTTEADLKEQRKALEEANITLRVILKTQEEARRESEQKIERNLQSLVLPLVESLQQSASPPQKVLLEEIKSNIEKVRSSFVTSLQDFDLSTTEIQIANLIKHGKTTKDIANISHVAVSTINTHRNNIRKKVGIKNKQTTLKNFLSSLN